MSATLYTNVRILDCTGVPAFAGSLLVEGNRIAAVVPAGAMLAAGDAMVVDGQGATLMPGLVEAHSHLTFTDVAQSVELGFIPPEEHMLRTAQNARRMLDAGFTSCFSAAAAKPRLDVALRNAIDSGDIPGPRTLAASPEMTVSAGLGDVRLYHMYRENFAVVCNGAEEFRRFSREMVREGVDTLKINVSGDSRHAGLAGRNHSNERCRSRRRMQCRASARQAYCRACAQRGVGEDVPAPWCGRDLSRDTAR